MQRMTFNRIIDIIEHYCHKTTSFTEGFTFHRANVLGVQAVGLIVDKNHIKLIRSKPGLSFSTMPMYRPVYKITTVNNLYRIVSRFGFADAKTTRSMISKKYIKGCKHGLKKAAIMARLCVLVKIALKDTDRFDLDHFRMYNPIPYLKRYNKDYVFSYMQRSPLAFIKAFRRCSKHIDHLIADMHEQMAQVADIAADGSDQYTKSLEHSKDEIKLSHHGLYNLFRHGYIV